VAFDPERVRDRATYAEPLLLPEGIERVWVNGELTYAAGRVTAARAGTVLRRGRP
jgi:N-acyl-D-amino-acid deacylase